MGSSLPLDIHTCPQSPTRSPACGCWTPTMAGGWQCASQPWTWVMEMPYMCMMVPDPLRPLDCFVVSHTSAMARLSLWRLCLVRLLCPTTQLLGAVAGALMPLTMFGGTVCLGTDPVAWAPAWGLAKT